MTNENNLKFGLSGNALKIISLILMTIDHIGCELFSDKIILRIIGRLAYPVFAYMLAEGCTYTKNRKKHLATIAFMALLCQVVYFVAMGSLYQCILVTFTLSIILIYTLDNAMKNKNVVSFFVASMAMIFTVFVTLILPDILSHTDYAVDYGFFGVLLPVLVYFSKERTQKLVVFSLGVCLVSAVYGGIQWFSLLAIPLVLLYNGRRGVLNIKYLFYIYYPSHLVIIHLIDLLT